MIEAKQWRSHPGSIGRLTGVHGAPTGAGLCVRLLGVLLQLGQTRLSYMAAMGGWDTRLRAELRADLTIG